MRTGQRPCSLSSPHSCHKHSPDKFIYRRFALLACRGGIASGSVYPAMVAYEQRRGWSRLSPSGTRDSSAVSNALAAAMLVLNVCIKGRRPGDMASDGGGAVRGDADADVDVDVAADANVDVDVGAGAGAPGSGLGGQDARGAGTGPTTCATCGWTQQKDHGHGCVCKCETSPGTGGVACVPHGSGDSQVCAGSACAPPTAHVGTRTSTGQ